MFSGICSNPTMQTGQLLSSRLLHHPHALVLAISSPFKVPWNSKYLLSNLSQVSSRQHLQVLQEGTGLQNLLVSLFIKLGSKEDVVLYGAILYPGLLGDIGYGALDGKDQST